VDVLGHVQRDGLPQLKPWCPKSHRVRQAFCSHGSCAGPGSFVGVALDGDDP
jgi:hypothetical protein